MSLRFKDKVVLITGGSRGIGSGCVRVFVRNGGKVVFCSRKDADGRKLEKEMNSLGPGEAVFVQCDVTKEEDIKRFVQTAVDKYSQIDCLINNAGWHPPHMSIDDFSAQDFRDLFELNVMSYFLASKYALPHLRKTEGCILNDSSLVEQIGQAGAVTYCATKGAISAMARALAVDEAKFNVRVNTFSPGNIKTDQWSVNATGDTAAFIKAGEDAQLFGRMGTEEEVGELCLYLAAEGHFLTGVTIPVSGGAELGYGKKTRKTVGSDVYAT